MSMTEAQRSWVFTGAIALLAVRMSFGSISDDVSTVGDQLRPTQQECRAIADAMVWFTRDYKRCIARGGSAILAVNSSTNVCIGAKQ